MDQRQGALVEQVLGFRVQRLPGPAWEAVSAQMVRSRTSERARLSLRSSTHWSGRFRPSMREDS